MAMRIDAHKILTSFFFVLSLSFSLLICDWWTEKIIFAVELMRNVKWKCVKYYQLVQHRKMLTMCSSTLFSDLQTHQGAANSGEIKKNNAITEKPMRADNFDATNFSSFTFYFPFGATFVCRTREINVTASIGSKSKWTAAEMISNMNKHNFSIELASVGGNCWRYFRETFFALVHIIQS